MNQEHVLNQIPDYVLGLLTRQERLWVEQHTAICHHCRQLLRQENEINQLVRTTLSLATQPSTLRLGQLMPAPPQPRPAWLTNSWQKQLAIAALLLTIIWGAFSLYQQQFSGSAVSPDQLAVTATMIHEPTMTLASTNEDQQKTLVGTAVPALIIEASATPTPVPTPIAALLSLSLN